VPREFAVVLSFAFLVLSSTASALTIDGFESDLVGASPAGAASFGGLPATVQTGAGFTGGAIAATEGTQFAYLTTGPGPNGTSPSPYDKNTNGLIETDWSEMTYSFAGSAGLILSLDYDLLTEEISGGVADIFAIILDGTIVASGAVGFASGTFPAVTTFATGPITGPDGSSFFDGRLGWTALSTPLTFSGVHTLEFYVADESDTVVDTALLADNIQLTPEPDTSMLLGLGLVGLVWSRRRQSRARAS